MAEFMPLGRCVGARVAYGPTARDEGINNQWSTRGWNVCLARSAGGVTVVHIRDIVVPVDEFVFTFIWHTATADCAFLVIFLRPL